MTKILLIEDDNILRNAYKTKLSLEGFEVYEAYDGQTGLEAAEEIRPVMGVINELIGKK